MQNKGHCSRYWDGDPRVDRGAARYTVDLPAGAYNGSNTPSSPGETPTQHEARS